MPSTEETIDIEAGGNAASLRTLGHDTISVHIRGDGAAEYEVDVATESGSWLQGAGPAYSGTADYDDVIQTGADRVRVRCTSGTGTADQTATITLMAGG